MELLKDGSCGGGDRRQSREGVNGPGGPRGDCDGDEAEWSGVSFYDLNRSPWFLTICVVWSFVCISMTT